MHPSRSPLSSRTDTNMWSSLYKTAPSQLMPEHVEICGFFAKVNKPGSTFTCAAQRTVMHETRHGAAASAALGGKKTHKSRIPTEIANLGS